MNFSVLYHVFPTTFHVISLKVDYLWDSVGLQVTLQHNLMTYVDVKFLLIQQYSTTEGKFLKYFNFLICNKNVLHFQGNTISIYIYLATRELW